VYLADVFNYSIAVRRSLRSSLRLAFYLNFFQKYEALFPAIS
jgi:hypothetical protein